MSDHAIGSRQGMTSQVIDRATRDPQFRQDLQRDPARTVEREFGVRIPKSIELRVVEETPSTLYLVLPPKSIATGEEISDQDLEQVAGGWSAHTETCAASQPCG